MKTAYKTKSSFLEIRSTITIITFKIYQITIKTKVYQLM